MTNAADTRQSLYPLRAVDRVCDIIDLLSEHPSGITLSTLAAALALPKSSAFRYLAALDARGYVLRSDDGMRYRLGSPLKSAATNGQRGWDRLVSAARPLMARLTSSEIPVALLTTLDGNGIRYLWVSTAPSAGLAIAADPRIPHVGDRALLHTTAAGKAIAAQLSDDIVLGMVGITGMPTPTTNSLASPTGLLRELHRIRGEGFAVSENERHADVRGVAVPIGGVPLALSVAGSGERFTAERVGVMVRQLRRAASALSRELRE